MSKIKKSGYIPPRFFFWLLLSVPIALLIHEMGHVIAALLFGVRILGLVLVANGLDIRIGIDREDSPQFGMFIDSAGTLAVLLSTIIMSIFSIRKWRRDRQSIFRFYSALTMLLISYSIESLVTWYWM